MELERLIPGLIAGIAGFAVHEGWIKRSDASFLAGMLVVTVVGCTIWFIANNPPMMEKTLGGSR